MSHLKNNWMNQVNRPLICIIIWTKKKYIIKLCYTHESVHPFSHCKLNLFFCYCVHMNSFSLLWHLIDLNWVFCFTFFYLLFLPKFYYYYFYYYYKHFIFIFWSVSREIKFICLTKSVLLYLFFFCFLFSV